MKWANLLPLIIVVAIGVAYVRWVRPRIRQSRYDRWERAGLLPEQTGEHRIGTDDDPPGERPHSDAG